jgi:hypothetical protein
MLGSGSVGAESPDSGSSDRVEYPKLRVETRTAVPKTPRVFDHFAHSGQYQVGRIEEAPRRLRA